MFPKVRECAPSVEPIAIGNFAGTLNFSAYSLPMRLIMRLIVRKQGGPTSGYHDFRDWDGIRRWAGKVYDLLAQRLGETSHDEG